MKKRIIPFLIALLVILAFLPVTVRAEEKTENDLLIEQVTDKEKYLAQENIETTLTVINANENGSDVLDVTLVNLVPEGYQLQENSQAQKNIQTLKAGESVTLTTVFEKLEDSGKVDPAKTGDSGFLKLTLVGIIAIFCILLIAGILIGKKKGKNKGIFLSCLIVAGISAMMIGGAIVTKAETLGQVSLTTLVSVDEKELQVKSTVSYGERTGSGELTGTEKSNGYYAVCIWNIQHQEDGTDVVTFGPAVGTSYEKAIENATELTDSWSEIQEAAANGTAHIKYADALREGYVKKIEITGNDFFSPSGTFSAFYSTIPSDYRKWNDNYSGASRDRPASNYASSRIRSTLNGVNNSWGRVRVGEYAGDGCLAASYSLLSCFPTELQEIITPRTFEVPTIWFASTPYEIIISESVTDKLWLPSASELYGFKEETAEYHDGGNTFQKNGGPLHIGIATYREDGRDAVCWLRSPDKTNYNNIAIIRMAGGGLDDYACTSTNCAVAPFFNIGGSAVTQ